MGEINKDRIYSEFDYTMVRNLTLRLSGFSEIKTRVDTNRLIGEQGISEILACCPSTQKIVDDALLPYRGAVDNVKSNSVFFVRETSGFDYRGEAYHFLPKYSFNAPVKIEYVQRYADPVYQKHQDEFLDSCNYEVLGKIEKVIGREGGEISIGDISQIIPNGAVENDTLFSIEKINLIECGCFNGIKDGDEDGIDCGGICQIQCLPSCADGVQNQDETGIDIGGICVFDFISDEEEKCGTDLNRNGIVKSCINSCGDAICDYPGEIGFYSPDDYCEIDCGEFDMCWDGTAEGYASCISGECGNGILERLSGEFCDDGNLIDGDGCSSYCLPEAMCSDGKLEDSCNGSLTFGAIERFGGKEASEVLSYINSPEQNSGSYSSTCSKKQEGYCVGFSNESICSWKEDEKTKKYSVSLSEGGEKIFEGKIEEMGVEEAFNEMNKSLSELNCFGRSKKMWVSDYNVKNDLISFNYYVECYDIFNYSSGIFELKFLDKSQCMEAKND